MSANVTYEDLQAKTETKESQESHILLVHIPDGFTRKDIGAKIEYDFGRVRVSGERSIGSNRISRFNEKYQVPSYCDIGSIKGSFDGKIITITMPKIPGKAPKQELEPTEQKAQESEETQPDEENDNKEGIPPQSATGDNAAEVKDQKGQQGTSDHDPKSTIEGHMPQKGQEENSQKADQVTRVESKGETNQETSTPPEATQESMSQKGQEEVSKKADQVTRVESKGEAGHHDETSTPPEATQESMTQRGQEGIPHKATVTSDAKLQTEENNTSGINDENKERQRVGKEESKDHYPKTAEESGKTPEKEISKEESKVSATVESFPPKDTEKEKGKEMNGKFGDDAERKSDRKGILPESTRTRIKDMAASTTQAVTSLAKRFNEEDKEKLIYTCAAILVVALGVYASYKYRSSRIP